MIYVTGGTGFTGRFVVDALLAAGETCRCLVRDRTMARRILPSSVDLVEGCLTGFSSLPGLSEADAVVHVAPIAIAGSRARVSADTGVERVLYFSSTWSVSSVRTPESEAVTAGEEIVMEQDIEWTIFRPTMIFGSGDRNVSRLGKWIRSHRFVPILDGGHRLVQPVFVEDVAQAVADAIPRRSTHGAVYEIAGPEPMTYSRMVDRIVEIEERTVAKLYLPGSLCETAARSFSAATGRRAFRDRILRMREDRAFSIDRASEDFGFAPRSFVEGLTAMRRLELQA